jgi:RNA polymerase sigma-70 factor, ECF subfamily
LSDTPIREADLDALMGRLAGGDRSAFDPLYRALRPRAVRLVRLRLGETGAADVAQAALLNVFSRASEFTPGRACLPWFYAIVANEIRASHRRDARFLLDEGAASLRLVDHEDAETQLVAREVERALEVAIDCLDDEAARAIGTVLGRGPAPNVPPATFRKRVSRAYAKLRILLGGHGAK